MDDQELTKIANEIAVKIFAKIIKRVEEKHVETQYNLPICCNIASTLLLNFINALPLKTDEKTSYLDAFNVSNKLFIKHCNAPKTVN